MKIKWFIFFLFVTIVSTMAYSFFNHKEIPPTKVGVLMVGENRHEKLLGLKDGLKNIGFEEAELEFIVRNAEDDAGALASLGTSLLEEHPDVIVTLGGIETLQLKTQLEARNVEIPVVFAGVAAPKEVGLIEDFRQPGGMFTGINNYHTIISGKRLELFLQLVPSINRVFAVYDGSVDLSELSLLETEAAAEKIGIDLIPIDIRNSSYGEKMKEQYKQGDALFILPSYKIEAMTTELVAITEQLKMPSMALYKHEVESGFLAGHGASFYEQGYQAARYVSSIIQGNLPSEMPVELPDEIRFMVNKEVSEHLGIELNSEWLFHAEIVAWKKGLEGGGKSE